MEVYASVHTNLPIMYILFGCWGSRMEELLYNYSEGQLQREAMWIMG